MELDQLISCIGDYTRDCILVTEAEPISDPGPRIVWCNRAFTDMTGYTLEEIRGKTPRILQGPETSPETCRKIRQGLERWQDLRVELKNYARDGTPFWVDLSITPVADESGWYHYWVSVQREITERKQNELALAERLEHLHRSEEMLRTERDKIAGIAAVAEHAQDLITITDTDFRIVWANPAFTRRTGFHPEAIKGLTHCDLLNKQSMKFSSREVAIKAMLYGEYGTQETRNTDSGGQHYWTETKVSVQRDELGRAQRFVVVEREVTERRRQDQALKDALSAAQAANRAKSQFLANMSHEIRTPMNGVIGMAELLSETRLSDEQRSCVETIEESANALLSIINDILDFSKVEAGKVSLDLQPLDVSRLVDDVAALLAAKAAEKRVELLVDDRLGGAQWFVGDTARLRQVMLNLVGNAVKFTLRGHVLVRVEHVPTEDSDGSPRLVITVTDTGIGIPAEKLQHIFKAFEQVDGNSSRQFEGTGLGLAISEGLVKLMNGRIRVSSTEGEGSEFRVEVALDPCPPAANVGALPDLSGRVALLVADASIGRRILARLLSRQGMTVVETDIDTATIPGRAAARRPDFVILEETSGAVDAKSLLTRLRSGGIGDRPVLLLTSIDRSIDQTDLRSAGFAEVILKPVRKTRLLRTIASIVGAKQAGDPPEIDTVAPRVDLSGRRILIAEDNRTNQLVFERVLGPTGAGIELCSNGREAVEAYRTRPPDLVIMDVSMPVLCGVSATRLIRSHERAGGIRSCPIIGATANAMDADRTECLEAGMTGFLAKPIRKAALFAEISRQLGLPGGEASAADSAVGGAVRDGPAPARADDQNSSSSPCAAPP